jgi:hypothetical protein
MKEIRELEAVFCETHLPDVYLGASARAQSSQSTNKGNENMRILSGKSKFGTEYKYLTKKTYEVDINSVILVYMIFK